MTEKPKKKKQKVHKFLHNRQTHGYRSYRERKARAEYIIERMKYYGKVALTAYLCTIILPWIYTTFFM